MFNISVDQILSAVRWVATTLGAYFASKGALSGEQVDLFVGAAVAIASFVWSMWVHKNTPPAAPTQ